MKASTAIAAWFLLATPLIGLVWGIFRYIVFELIANVDIFYNTVLDVFLLTLSGMFVGGWLAYGIRQAIDTRSG